MHVYMLGDLRLLRFYVTNAPSDMDRLFLIVVVHHSLTKL